MLQLSVLLNLDWMEEDLQIKSTHISDLLREAQDSQWDCYLPLNSCL